MRPGLLVKTLSEIFAPFDHCLEQRGLGIGLCAPLLPVFKSAGVGAQSDLASALGLQRAEAFGQLRKNVPFFFITSTSSRVAGAQAHDAAFAATTCVVALSDRRPDPCRKR